jgi:hypothetical protein
MSDPEPVNGTDHVAVPSIQSLCLTKSAFRELKTFLSFSHSAEHIKNALQTKTVIAVRDLYCVVRRSKSTRNRFSCTTEDRSTGTA